MKLKRLVAVCLSLSMILSMSACGKQDIPELIQANKALKVYYNVTKGDIKSEKVYDATVAPAIQNVTAKIGGKIYNLDARVGDSVSKDDVLFSINENYSNDIAHLEYELSVYESITDYYVKKNNETIASMNTNLAGLTGMAYELYEVDIKQTRVELDKQENGRELGLQNIQEQYDNLVNNKDFVDVKAPCDGIITNISVHKDGDSVSEDSVVVSIADSSAKYIELDYGVYDELLEMEEVYVLCGDKKYEDIEIVQFTDEELSVMDEEFQKYNTRIKINDPDFDPEYGTYAAVYASYDKVEQCIFAPNEAVFTESQTGVQYCLVLNANDEEERRNVTIGMKTDYYTEITEGLSEGDRIYYMDDAGSWTSEASKYEVTETDYTHSMTFNSATKKSYNSTYMNCPCKGTIKEVYVDLYEGVYVEEGTELFKITPDVSNSVLEKGIKDYEEDYAGYKSSLDYYNEQIEGYEKAIKEAKTDIERTVAEYELEKLTYGYDLFVEGLDEGIKDKKRINDTYVKIQNGEEITVTAPCSGIFIPSDGGITIEVGSEISLHDPIGNLCDKDSYVVLVSDSSDALGASGFIKYGNKVSIKSGDSEISGTAITCSNIYLHRTNDEFKVVIRLEDDTQAILVNNVGTTVTVSDINISNVVVLPKGYVNYDDGGYYVLMKYNDSIIKRYVTLGTNAIMEDEYVWIKTGLNFGDVCIMY